MRAELDPRSSERPLVLVGARRRKAFEGLPDAVVCVGRRACSKALEESAGSLWVSLDPSILVGGIEAWLPRARGERRLGHLLLLQAPEHEHVPVLRSLFDRISGEEPSFAFLPLEELLDVLTAPAEEARDLVIGGTVDRTLRALVLVRGDLTTVVVSLGALEPRGGVAPDARRLAFTDFGHSVRLGEYEAATDALLYRVDADFRRRLNARRRAEETGFGPSLRRLRKQRGLRRTDFPGVSAKTIARVERGETAPRGRTLKVIEKRLGLASDEIETY